VPIDEAQSIHAERRKKDRKRKDIVSTYETIEVNVPKAGFAVAADNTRSNATGETTWRIP
jgi:hypothetical protein